MIKRVTMPRLEFDRKDMRRPIDRWKRRDGRPLPENAFTVAVSWPGSLAGGVGSLNRGYMAS